MAEWIKWLLATFGAAIIGFLAKQFEWLRFKPKDVVDVRSTEQDIESKRLEDDLKRGKFTMDLLVTAEAQLEKANLKIDAEERENEKLHNIIQQMRDEMEVMRIAFNNRTAALEQSLRDSASALNEERSHCNSIRKQLDEIKRQYGIN